MAPMLGTMLTLLAQADPQKTLVDRDKLNQISEHYNSGARYSVPWELLLVGLGLTLLAVAVISMRRWWLRRHDDPSPLVLYSAIARRAGLGWADRFTLWRIARASGLPTPIALLLARGTLHHHATAFAKHLGPRARARLDERIHRIEAELFG